MSDTILATPQLATEGAAPAPKTITLKIPQLNIQAVILGLLAIVTIFQTIQLYTLKSNAANLTVKAATGTSAPASGSNAPAAGGNDQGLQGMVGGC